MQPLCRLFYLFCLANLGYIALDPTITCSLPTITCSLLAQQPKEVAASQSNLALDKAASASGEELSKNNLAKHAVDGDLQTRWCAASAARGEWLQIDLGSVQTISALRLHWEQSNVAYTFKIEDSVDATAWHTLTDASTNSKAERIVAIKVPPRQARYLRITYLGSKSGAWGSLWEVEVAEKELPKLARNSQTKPSAPPSLADIKAPTEFDVHLFAVPPEVNYPVCLTAAATGELFVGVDEQGSLGKEPGRGRIVRCIDRDGDGKADEFNTFAQIDHPRGLIYDHGQLWVLHPPTLSLLTDRDGDGTSDEQKVLISNISTQQVDQRGADHTTNGIRMGIDGWIYIAVGDFGFVDATGTDGRALSRRGGGIVRVRPDGTDMEIYSWGQRNILDVCIDPYLNMFTRDNTNDGGGWDVRVTHVLQGADYGYPSKYKNFSAEIMPPMADYGGGSGCGGMYLFDPRWPEAFRSAAYTCDWGTSQVYRHHAISSGATFQPNQEVFLSLPRPTDIDIDGSGRMFVSSWKNGSFNFSDPNVGFVAQVVPRDFSPEPFPDVSRLSSKELVASMRSGNSVHALHTQREFLRRGKSNPVTQAELESALWQLIRDSQSPLAGRVAGLFTLKQLAGIESHTRIIELAERDAPMREFALRALTDRMGELDALSSGWFVGLLDDADARVRAQALVCLARLGRAGRLRDAQAANAAVAAILPLTIVRDEGGAERTEAPPHQKADSARVLPHLAIRALRDIDAPGPTLSALNGPYQRGTLWALREMRSSAVVDGLLARLRQTTILEQRYELIDLLSRLYFREGDYTRGDWWGTRPDTTGPYYDRVVWDDSSKIGEVLQSVFKAAEGEPTVREQLNTLYRRYRLPFGDPQSNAAEDDEPQQPILLKPADPQDPNQIGNLSYATVLERASLTPGRARRGARLFKSQNCNACHTDAAGQTPKGPHLVDIGKRYRRTELVESIVNPSAKLAQGFESWSILTTDGKVVAGFVVLESAEMIKLRQANGLTIEIPKDEVETRKKQEQSMMPAGLVDSLTAEQLSDLVAYLESLR